MFKTIVVHVDDSERRCEACARAAAWLASEFGAHLVGSAATGVSYASYAMLYGSMAMPAPEAEFEALRTRARAHLAAFDTAARRHGADSVEQRVLDEDTRAALLMESRYADLVVTSQEPLANPIRAWAEGSALPAYLALHSGRPVLVVPEGYGGGPLAQRIAIGWDGSVHAMRALTFALPLLQRAAMVRLLLINPNPLLDSLGEEPGADMAVYLARHGVPVEVMAHYTDVPVGDALETLARDSDASLIVAGAYGHTRLREVVLGGVTRTLLGRSALPLLLAH